VKEVDSYRIPIYILGIIVTGTTIAKEINDCSDAPTLVGDDLSCCDQFGFGHL
jgi:hypothetical protein